MLRLVRQVHDTGCFIACIATLLGISYRQAFKRIHPHRAMPPKDRYDWEHQVGVEIDQAIKLMPTLGLQVKRANLRRVSSLRRRTSLVLLRWKFDPTRGHGIIFDGEVSQFLDPCNLKLPLHEMQENLEAIYYVKANHSSATA